MTNEALVSLTGYVATQPRWRETSSGTPNITMRVAWTPRRIDRSTGEWVDGNTSYVTVVCWRKLADNVATCLRKGDPVVVNGRLSVRPYEDRAGVPRTAVEVDANSVGHDLSRGVAQFQRTRPPTGKTADEYAAELAAGGAGDTGTMSALGETGLGETGQGQPGPGEAGLGEATASDPSGSEMFDESAIATLAREPEGAGAPF
jgi:single-strand DNA-binding protein